MRVGVLIIEKVADIAFFLSLGWLGGELWSLTRERAAGQAQENRVSPETSQAA